MSSKSFWQKLPHPILALAPMAGITDSAFRLLCKKFGADVVYTEMISADGIVYNSRKTLELLKFEQAEKPIVAQLFGKKPENFYRAAKIIRDLFDFDGIDINLGCPAKKVFGHGSGAALMDNKELGKQIIRATIEAAGALPVSIKIRSGVKDTPALEFLDFIKDLPIAAIMIHGRTYEQGFSGSIDLEICKKVVETIKIPVLVNGGIQKPENSKEILEYTGASGIGIGRSSLGQPWIFKQIKNYLKDQTYENPDFKQIKKIAVTHSEFIYQSKAERGLLEIRKHLAWYIKGFDGASALRSKLVQAQSVKEIKEIFDTTHILSPEN